jgi:hypothetical protein
MTAASLSYLCVEQVAQYVAALHCRSYVHLLDSNRTATERKTVLSMTPENGCLLPVEMVRKG